MNDVIKKEIAKLNDKIVYQEILSDMADILEALADDLCKSRKVDGAYHHRLVQLTTAAGGPGALQGLIFSVSGVVDIRTEMLPVLRAIRAQGLKMTGKPVEYQELDRITWKMVGEKREDGLDRIAVHVHAFLASNSESGSVCRWVKVGVKEEPVMELQCGDSTVNLEELANA